MEVILHTDMGVALCHGILTLQSPGVGGTLRQRSEKVLKARKRSGTEECVVKNTDWGLHQRALETSRRAMEITRWVERRN